MAKAFAAAFKRDEPGGQGPCGLQRAANGLKEFGPLLAKRLAIHTAEDLKNDTFLSIHYAAASEELPEKQGATPLESTLVGTHPTAVLDMRCCLPSPRAGPPFSQS